MHVYYAEFFFASKLSCKIVVQKLRTKQMIKIQSYKMDCLNDFNYLSHIFTFWIFFGKYAISDDEENLKRCI